MLINITNYFNNTDHAMISGSAFELGQNAARITWNNAKDAAKNEALLDTPEKLDAMRDYARSTGGWTREEIAKRDDQELNALFYQFVSGDVRKLEDLCMTDEGEIDWDKYEDDPCSFGGHIMRGQNGEIFYYLGE